jgi:membrane-bound ClpP family serine protease
MKMSIDKQKITDVLKAAGGEAAAGMVDTALAGFDAVSGEGIPMDSTVAVVKENGTWLICQ